MADPKTLAAAAQAPDDRDLAVPAYYEVWGGLESANRALWAALWLSISVSTLLFIMLRLQIGRPPVVIRVDDSGRAELVADPGRQPPLSEAEVKNFLALFERFFTQLNSYTYESDLKAAFAMMTPAFRSEAGDMLKRAGVVERLKNDERRTALTLTEIRVLGDAPDALHCEVKGYRELGSYKSDAGAAQEVVFEDDIVLKKVPRSETAPNGLLVQAWSESLFKK